MKVKQRITLFVFVLGVITICWFILLYVRGFTVETQVLNDRRKQPVDNAGAHIVGAVEERNVLQGLNKSDQERLDRIMQYKIDWENDEYSEKQWNENSEQKKDVEIGDKNADKRNR